MSERPRRAPGGAEAEIPDLAVPTARREAAPASPPQAPEKLFGSGAMAEDLFGSTAQAGEDLVGSAAQAGAGQPELPAPSPQGPGVSHASPENYFGAGTFDADHFASTGGLEDGGGLDLALEEGSSLSGPGAAPSGAGFTDLGGELGDELEGNAVPLAAPGPDHPGPETSRWPSGSSPEPTTLEIDGGEVQRVAAFGPPPANPVTTIAYAFRVLLRRRALRSRVLELDGALREAEAARDEALAGMVQALRPQLEQDDRFAVALVPVAELEQVARERSAALAGASSEQARSRDAYAQERQEGEQRLEEREAQRKARQAALDEQEEALARLQARHKRVYIEIRSILDVADRDGGRIPEDWAPRLQDLETQAAALKEELGAATERVRAAQAAVRTAEGEVRQARRQLEDTEKRRRAAEQQFHRQIGSGSASLREAEEQRRLALANIGRTLLSKQGTGPSIDPEILETIARADERVRDAAVALETHVRALHGHDQEAARRGFILAGVLAVVLLLVVVFVAGR